MFRYTCCISEAETRQTPDYAFKNALITENPHNKKNTTVYIAQVHKWHIVTLYYCQFFCIFFVLLQLVTQVMSCYRLFLYSDRRLAALSICMHFCNTLSNFKFFKWPVTNVLDPFYIRCIQDILFVAVHFLLFRTMNLMPQQHDCYSDDIHLSFFVSAMRTVGTFISGVS